MVVASRARKALEFRTLRKIEVRDLERLMKYPQD
jgi:hypothetical protein